MLEKPEGWEERAPRAPRREGGNRDNNRGPRRDDNRGPRRDNNNRGPRRDRFEHRNGEEQPQQQEQGREENI